MTSRIVRFEGRHVVVHGREMQVSNVRRTGQQGWVATLSHQGNHFLAVQTTPPTVAGDPEAERWLVMVGRTARYFAVSDGGIRDLAA